MIIDSYKLEKTLSSNEFMDAFLSIVVEQKFVADQSGFLRLNSSKTIESLKLYKIRDLIAE